MATETSHQPSEAQPMNAKERRKLQREQERLQVEASAATKTASQVVAQDAATPVSKQTVTVADTAATDAAPVNAKERRKLAREAERVAQEAAAAAAAAAPPKPSKKASAAAASTTTTNSDATITAASSSTEKLNAKQRRLQARKASRPDEPVAAPTDKSKKRKRAAKAGAGSSDPNAPPKKVKSIHLTLFVGQLPFSATEANVRAHFHEAGDIQVRMLTDKRTKKFKGTAFIEVADSKALGAALSRHHSLLNGRRINVEMTASGGGTKSEQRTTKLELLRKKQSNVQVEKTKALIQKHIDSRQYQLTQDDVDDRMIDFLSWFDYETAKKALEEYNRCVGDRVMNRKAFFMGILKRFRETDGVE